ncbi:MAG: patatin-like phospholipase family protein [Alcaligenaceae bacterium]|nr:patatin-like phospholipase family protein [Alcaligenaceae bacterium]
MTSRSIKSPLEEKFAKYPRVALVLQGGGALGSYQAGVIEGLLETKCPLSWVAGISIGALNCAIIAGNKPEDRVAKLREFWTTICRAPSQASHTLSSIMDMWGAGASALRELAANSTEKMFGSFAATQTLLEGQKDFFIPRLFAPGTGTPAQISYYDTSPLIETLRRLCDFDRINSDEMRVSVGATNVRNGNFVYFDNTEITLTPEHFVASGSLPPGFAATEIDGEFYWDGGCVSNTPLEQIMVAEPREDTLVFQIDLWSARGDLPTDIFRVLERQKDIQYSSRTRHITNTVKEIQKLRQVIFDIVERVPASVRSKDPYFKDLLNKIQGARFNCIHLIYQNKPSEGHYKDFEFSHETMSRHWGSGLNDIRRTFQHTECLDMPASGQTFVQFDVHRQK